MTSLCFRRSLLFKSSSVYLTHWFHKLYISITVTSDPDCSLTSPSIFSLLSTGITSTIAFFLYILSHMASFLDIVTIRTLGIGKVYVLGVPAAVSERALLTCYLLSVSKTFRKRRSWLDICLFFLESRHQCGFMHAQMRKQTGNRDNPRLLYRS